MSLRALAYRTSTTVLVVALACTLGSSANAAAPESATPTQPAVPALQLRAAKLQAEFVRASLDLDRARFDLAAARSEVRVAKATAGRAQSRADIESGTLGSYLSDLYVRGPAMDSDLMLLLTGLDQTDAMWRQNLVFEEVSADQATVVERAQRAQAAADLLHEAARAKQDEADSAAERVQVVLRDISVRADEVTAQVEDSLTDNADAALFSDRQQEARDQAAKGVWQGYRGRLRRADVTPPRARALVNPAHLPRGLKPLRGKGRHLIPGVAVTAGPGSVTVLPRQVVAAIDAAYTALGTPYAAGSTGPETYDCSGLVAASYPGLHLPSTPAGQYEKTTVVPRADIQVGDLVFFATDGAGIHHVGIYLGGNLMLAADGTASQVGVLSLPSRPYAVTRPSLPLRGKAHPAPEGDGSQQMSCGAEVSAGGVTSAGMVSPVAEGSFHFTGRFGDPGAHWDSGFHTGLDFAAPVGTQVVAAREGTASISHPAWAGNLVTVDHGDGLTSRYAHLSAIYVKPGERVLAGQGIGAVGQEGNTTGPHLHFEVVVLDTPVDPMLFLSSESSDGNLGWGGYLNGLIPTSVLCPLSSAPGQLLRCDAARTYDALAGAYRAQFGSDLCITDSYRSYALQVTTFAHKPGLAAVPGTSNHGWGLAVDLCGGIELSGSAQHAWMSEHAAKFGWVNPDWAQPGGGRPEPWHWEFGNPA